MEWIQDPIDLEPTTFNRYQGWVNIDNHFTNPPPNYIIIKGTPSLKMSAPGKTLVIIFVMKYGDANYHNTKLLQYLSFNTIELSASISEPYPPVFLQEISPGILENITIEVPNGLELNFGKDKVIDLEGTPITFFIVADQPSPQGMELLNNGTIRIQQTNDSMVGNYLITVSAQTQYNAKSTANFTLSIIKKSSPVSKNNFIGDIQTQPGNSLHVRLGDPYELFEDPNSLEMTASVTSSSEGDIPSFANYYASNHSILLSPTIDQIGVYQLKYKATNQNGYSGEIFFKIYVNP